MSGKAGVGALLKHPYTIIPVDEAADAQWRTLYWMGAWVGIVAIAMIPVSIIVFVVWPPPETESGHFARLQLSTSKEPL